MATWKPRIYADNKIVVLKIKLKKSSYLILYLYKRYQHKIMNNCSFCISSIMTLRRNVTQYFNFRLIFRKKSLIFWKSNLIENLESKILPKRSNIGIGIGFFESPNIGLSQKFTVIRDFLLFRDFCTRDVSKKNIFEILSSGCFSWDWILRLKAIFLIISIIKLI